MGFAERGVIKRPCSLNEALCMAMGLNGNFPQSVKEIDLGPIANIANRLRAITKINPRHTEEFVIDREPILKNKPVYLLKKNTGDYNIQGYDFTKKNKLFKKILHSGNTPPSLREDIIPILLKPIGEMRCVIKTTPETNFLIVPGPKTPALNPDELSLLLKKWEERKEEIKFEAMDEKIKEASVFKMGTDAVKEIIGLPFGRVLDHKLEGLEEAVNWKVFKEVVCAYGLIAFSGPANKQTVSRVTELKNI